MRRFRSFSSLNTTEIPLVRTNYRWTLTKVAVRICTLPNNPRPFAVTFVVL